MLRFERAHIGHATGPKVSPVSFPMRPSVLQQHALVRTGKLVIPVSRRGGCSGLGSWPAGRNPIYFRLDPDQVRAEAGPSAPHVGARYGGGRAPRSLRDRV